MDTTATAPPEQAPIALRSVPPPARGLHRKRLILCAAILGLFVVGATALKFQGRYSAAFVRPPAPLPDASQVARSDAGLDPLLNMPKSYAGLDRRPPAPVVVQAPAPEPPPLAVSPPPIVTEPPPPPAPPAKPQPAPRPPPPPPVHQAPAATPPPEPVKPPAPKRWLFAAMSGQQGQAQAQVVNDANPPASAVPAKRTASKLVQPAVWEKPVDPTKVLYRAQVIYGTLLHQVVSDFPGPIRILVTRDVTDRFSQGVVLLPKNTVLLGEQQGTPDFGQSRLPVTIDEAQLPNGTILALQGSLGDKTGANALKGKTNHHLVRIGVSAVISAAMTIGTRAFAGSPQGFLPTLGQEYAAEVGESFQRTSKSIIDKQLEVPPTITIKANTPVSMYFESNISLYHPPVAVE